MSLFSSKLLKYGFPFIVLVVGGSFGLKQFTNIRFEYSKQKLLKESAEEKGIVMKDSAEVTLEKEYEKIDKIDINNWENKRGPRPWEENNELYLEAQERAKNIAAMKAKRLENQAPR